MTLKTPIETVILLERLDGRREARVIPVAAIKSGYVTLYRKIEPNGEDVPTTSATPAVPPRRALASVAGRGLCPAPVWKEHA